MEFDRTNKTGTIEDRSPGDSWNPPTSNRTDALDAVRRESYSAPLNTADPVPPRARYGQVAPGAIEAVRGFQTTPANSFQCESAPARSNSVVAVSSSLCGQFADSGAGLTPKEREIVRRSLHPNLELSSFLLESAVGGVLGSGPIPWALDRVTRNTEGRFADTWRRFGSPLSRELSMQEARLGEAQSQLAVALGERSARRTQVLAQSISPRQEMQLGRHQLEKMCERVQTDMTKCGSNIERYQLYQRKLDLLDKVRHSAGTVDSAYLQSVCLPPHKVSPARGKFITEPERDFLLRHKENYDRRLSLIDSYKASSVPVLEGRASIRTLTDSIHQLKDGVSSFNFWGTERGAWSPKLGAGSSQIERIAGEWRCNKWTNKLGEGIAMGGVALGADWLADRLLGQEQGTIGRPSYYLEYPLVSAALLWDKIDLRKKIATTTAAVALGRLIDASLPYGDSSYSALMAPNWIDAVGMSAAWTLPWSSSRARMFGVGGAWLTGRLGNIANNIFHIPVFGVGDPNYGLMLNTKLDQSLASDQSALSHGSFQSIVEQGARLGLENDAALSVQIQDYVSLHKCDSNKAAFSHGLAALETALGDTIFKRGCKIDKHDSMENVRILAGEDIDLGGQSLQFFRSAAANLIELQNHASDSGLSASQIEDLKQSCGSVERRIERIYGEHSIDTAFEKLKGAFVQRQQDLSEFTNRFIRELKGMPARAVDDDPRHVAKLCRDAALLQLAIADCMAERKNFLDSTILYEDALRMLDGAGRWDAGAPDLPKLRCLAQRVAARIR